MEIELAIDAVLGIITIVGVLTTLYLTGDIFYYGDRSIKMIAEGWWDVVNKASAAIGGAVGLGKAIEAVVEDATKRYGYVIWDSMRDSYLLMLQDVDSDNGYVAWSKIEWSNVPVDAVGIRVLLIDGELDMIQGIIDDSISGKLYEVNKQTGVMVYEPLMLIIFNRIKKFNHNIKLVPCIIDREGKIDLDFVRILTFNWGS